MRRALLMLVTACTLDPQGVLDGASLKVDLFGADGGKVKLRVTDSTATTVEKNAMVHGDPAEVLFEAHALADGDVTIEAELFDASGALIGCAVRGGQAGPNSDPVNVGFTSPSDDQLNCGTCGNRCVTPNADVACVAAMCTFTCNSGYVPADGGCVRPVMMMMDAGVPDAGMQPDAGPTCMPTPESSEVACSDGLDNNCDLRTDCADPGCVGLARACTMSGGCMGPGMQTWDCASRMWGPCMGDQATENDIASCSDGIDNDCDGKKDCADDGCQNVKVPCPGGICAGGVKLWNCTTHLLGLCLPYIPLPEAPLLCGDGLDNDCNNKTDCADDACGGKSCGLGKTCCPDHTCGTSCP